MLTYIKNFLDHIYGGKYEITNTLDIANYFNKYFCNIGQSLANNIKVPNNLGSTVPGLSEKSIFITPTAKAEIEQIIFKMKDEMLMLVLMDSMLEY